MLYLRRSAKEDLNEIESLYERSSSLHLPWTYPPKDYDSYISEEGRYFLCLQETDDIVGTFHISGIARGYFQSAYLGYEAFSPYSGKGYMRTGLGLLIKEAFDSLNLHRLEANIQPGNVKSIMLVAGAGFTNEGYSRNYLNIGGRGWKDHERWALINDQWSDHNSQ